MRNIYEPRLEALILRVIYTLYSILYVALVSLITNKISLLINLYITKIYISKIHSTRIVRERKKDIFFLIPDKIKSCLDKIAWIRG